MCLRIRCGRTAKTKALAAATVTASAWTRSIQLYFCASHALSITRPVSSEPASFALRRLIVNFPFIWASQGQEQARQGVEAHVVTCLQWLLMLLAASRFDRRRQKEKFWQRAREKEREREGEGAFLSLYVYALFRLLFSLAV